MITLNIQLQITVICFLAIILFKYMKSEKLPLLSTRCFSLMIVFASINLVFDIVTVFTVSDADVLASWFNRLCHQIYIASLDTLMFVSYLYVDLLGDSRKKFIKRESFLAFVIYIISLGMIVFAPLYYIQSKFISYSYGPMLDVLYIATTLYMVLILSVTFLYKHSLNLSKKMAILGGSVIWAIIVLIQFMKPELQISSLFVVLMIFFIFITFENPTQHMDVELNCFNKRAFLLMIDEMFRNKIDFYIVSLVFEDISFVYSKTIYEGENGILLQAVQEMKNVFGGEVFRSKGNSFSVIMASKNMTIEECLKIVENTPIGITKIHINILECPKYATKVDEVFEIIKFASEQKVAAANHMIPINIVDDTFLAMRTRTHQIESIIKKAIDEDGFEVWYQPIYSTKHSCFLSAEALVRLKDSQTIGFVSPEEFIPIAEKKGLIMELGSIVFEKVCAFAAKTDLEAYGVKYVEVNLSGIQGVNPTLPKQLKMIMEKYQINPMFINLEITETATVESGEMLNKNMNQLRSMGCSFSMDDFGTGYSNLSQMAEISYDLVKIDKSLIWPCFDEVNEKPNLILSSVVNMIRMLGIKIVAEGVETKEQVEVLTNMGINYLQGYYFSKPITERSYLEFLEDKRQAASQLVQI